MQILKGSGIAKGLALGKATHVQSSHPEIPPHSITEQEREAEATAAREKANGIWQDASRDGSHPYLDAKGIKQPRGVRFWRDNIVVPMWRDGKIASVQLKYRCAIGEFLSTASRRFASVPQPYRKT